MSRVLFSFKSMIYALLIKVSLYNFNYLKFPNVSEKPTINLKSYTNFKNHGKSINIKITKFNKYFRLALYWHSVMIFYDIKQLILFVIYAWFKYKNHLKIHPLSRETPHLSKVTLYYH